MVKLFYYGGKEHTKQRHTAMNNLEAYKTILKASGYKIYSPSNTLAFALSENKTLVITPLQIFYVKHWHRNYLPSLQIIRKRVKRNKIKTIVDLVTEMQIKIGEGLELVTTDINHHIGIWK